MYIYTSEKVLPYVYLCIHKTSGEYYIGYREANKVPSHLDLPNYKTSSKIVNPMFNEFQWTILAEFFDGNDAYNFEQNIIREHWKDPLLLNGNISGKIKSNNKNKVTVKDHSNNIFQVDKSDPRYVSGELKFYAVGIKRTEEFKIKQSVANKNKVNMYDPTLDKNIKVSIDDPRINSGELIPMNLGKKRTEETKKRQSISNKKPKVKTVCRIFDKKEMILANFNSWNTGSYSKRKYNKEPKPRVVCRIVDKKEMTLPNFTRWNNSPKRNQE